MTTTHEPPDAVQIGRHLIGPGHPCFVVAEMSGNHGHDFERARRIVQAAAAAGADAVKFQAYRADTITLDHDGADFRIAPDNSWADYHTLYQLYEKAYTPWEWLEPLTEEANRLGMEAFASVFDATSVDWLAARNSCAYKIAAPEITDIPLLRKVAETGKPVILSSGLADEQDLHLAIDTLREAGCHDIVLLKCTSEYPAPVDEANLRTIADIPARFACLAGLSDHTTNTTVPVASVCMGADIVEKHFTLDETATVDSFFSLRPDAFASMVEQIRLAESALGQISYEPSGLKSGNINGRRSLYAAKPIRRGEPFTAENVRSVRPAFGLHPRHYDTLLGSIARRDIEYGDRLTDSDLPDATAPALKATG